MRVIRRFTMVLAVALLLCAGLVAPASAATAPGPVPSLTATEGGGSIGLSWEGPSTGGPVEGYNIYRDGSILAVFNSLSTWFVDDGPFAEGTTYTYQVAAFSAEGGEGPKSPVASATLAYSLPGPVRAAGGEVVSDTSVRVYWQAPTTGGTVSGYNIYRDGALVQVLAAGTLEWTDTGLTPGTAYGYQIRAYGPGGDGQLSLLGLFTPGSAAPPDVTNLDVQVWGSGVLHLEWYHPDASNGLVEGYDLFANGAKVATLERWVFSYDYTAPNFSPVTFRVVAFGPGGAAPGVEVTGARVQGATGLAVSTKTTTSITLTWNPYSGTNVGYSVYRGTSADWEGSEWLEDVTATSYTFTGLEPNTAYHLWVWAYDDFTSPELSYISAQTNGLVSLTPNQPFNLRAAGSKDKVTLVWSAPAGGGVPTGYKVYRDGALLTTVTAATYVDIAPGSTPHTYQVTAVNAAGESSKSPAVTGGALVAPGPPVGLVAEPKAEGINLIWQAPSAGAPTGYRVYRVAYPKPETPAASWWTKVAFAAVPGTLIGVTEKTSFLDPAVVQGDKYDYHVTAYNTEGESNAAVLASVQPGAPHQLAFLVSLQGIGDSVNTWLEGLGPLWLQILALLIAALVCSWGVTQFKYIRAAYWKGYYRHDRSWAAFREYYGSGWKRFWF